MWAEVEALFRQRISVKNSRIAVTEYKGVGDAAKRSGPGWYSYSRALTNISLLRLRS